MKITGISILMIMAGYFLILYSAVAWIQDKRLFGSAPEEIQKVIPESRPERCRGAHIIGWLIFAAAMVLFLGSIVLAAGDGIRNEFGFPEFFARFLMILYAMEIYDIFFFDWVLLCHSNFYPHFCPECKGMVGPQLFGFNKKTHILHFLEYIPACAVAAWICTLFQRFSSHANPFAVLRSGSLKWFPAFHSRVQEMFFSCRQT